MELVLTDGKVLDDLAHADRSIWQKVKAWIVGIITKIKKYYSELNQASKTARVLRDTMDSLDEIERLFTEGAREAGERTRKAGVENVTGEYSRKMKVTVRKGFLFDYAESLLANESNIEMDLDVDKNKENPNPEAVYGEPLATTSRKEFPENSVAQESASVNRKYAISEEYSSESPDEGKTRPS